MKFELWESILVICARTAIPTGYLRNWRFKLFTIVIREGVSTIKVYAGIATLAFLREPSAKAKIVQKPCNGHVGDWTYYLEGARRVCCTNRLTEWLYIYSLNYKAVKVCS